MKISEEFETIEKRLLNIGYKEVSLDIHRHFKAKTNGYICVVSTHSIIENLNCGMKNYLNNYEKFCINNMPMAKNHIVEVCYKKPMKIFFKNFESED